MLVLVFFIIPFGHTVLTTVSTDDAYVNGSFVASLRQVYAPFLETLRRAHPRRRFSPSPPSSLHGKSPAKMKMKACDPIFGRSSASTLATATVTCNSLKGQIFLAPLEATDRDGTHPNDLGFQWMAEGLAPRLRRMLSL